MNSHLKLSLSVLLLIVMLTSCSTVRVPDSDPTPPEATIVMSRLEEINRYEHEEIIMGTLTNVVIIAHGHDPDGGIRNTTLAGDIQIRCDDAENGESIALIENINISNPDPNFPPVPERAKKIRSVIYNVTPEVTASWRALCTEDTVFRRLQADFIAATINFNGDRDGTSFVTIRMSGQ